MELTERGRAIAGWYDRLSPYYTRVWPLLVPSYADLGLQAGRLLSSLRVSPRRVLDLGCGPATQLATLAPRWPGTRVALLDASSRMLALARASLGPLVALELHHEYGARPLPADLLGPQDLILASLALHHLPAAQIMALYQQLSELLAPGGHLLVAEEVVSDAPAGRDVVAAVRRDYMESNRPLIPPAFLAAHASVPPAERPPFYYARVDDHVSWLASAGLAVAAPVVSLGSALLLAFRA